ncbi:MAG: glycosyltransferase family 4 protein [Bryobacteraceae bacterium]
MNILAVQPFADGIGHYGPYATRLCGDFCARGHRVTLCANTRPDREQHPFEIVVMNFALRPFEDVRRTRPLHWLWGRIGANLRTLRAALRISGASDVVQLFSYELVSTAIVLMLWPPSRPVILEIAAPNFDASKHYGALSERLWRRIQKLALRYLVRYRLAAINVYSAAHASELRRQLDLAPQFPVRVTADSRVPVESSIDRAQARLRLGLDPAATVFLFFGTIRRDKGLDNLITAFRALPESCHLLIAGKPLDLAGPAIADPRITARYDFIPANETELYFAAADVLVLPYESFYSGSSGPLFDACAHGLPVVASRVSELGRLVTEHGLGIAVEPGSVDSLGAGLAAFEAAASGQREQWSRNASRLIELVSCDAVADSYIALYESLASGKS